MGSKPVIILIVLALMAGTLLHRRQQDKNAIDIDRIAVALTGLDKLVPKETNIKINPIQLSNTVALWSRYILAPRFCSLDPDDKIDTVLTICKTATADSIVNRITENKRLLWRNEDDQFRYFLTCKQ